MRHDSCTGCKYETIPATQAPCVQCRGNYIDCYTPANVWDRIRGMEDYELMEFLNRYRDNPEKSLEEVLNDTHY